MKPYQGFVGLAHSLRLCHQRHTVKQGTAPGWLLSYARNRPPSSSPATLSGMVVAGAFPCSPKGHLVPHPLECDHIPTASQAEVDDLILARLGSQRRAFAFSLGGREWSGFRAPSRAAGMQPRSLEMLGAYDDMQRNELDGVRQDKVLRDNDVRFFVGDGGETLYAIPHLPPVDVIELARVGTHNGGLDDWRLVQAFLLETAAPFGFDIVFADEAGLDVQLPGAVELETARSWDRCMLDRIERRSGRWLDSYSFMLDEALRRGLESDPKADGRGGGLVPAFIVATRSIRLWWD